MNLRVSQGRRGVKCLPLHWCIIADRVFLSRSLWPRGLKRGAFGPRFLALRVRMPPRPWMSVSCGCCVLSGRGLCDDPITRPEASCRLWCVSLSGIRCSSDQHLQWIGRRCQNKKEFLLLDSVSGECHQTCDWKRPKYEYSDANRPSQSDLQKHN
jgi:hypothetical protein